MSDYSTYYSPKFLLAMAVNLNLPDTANRLYLKLYFPTLYSYLSPL